MRRSPACTLVVVLVVTVLVMVARGQTTEVTSPIPRDELATLLRRMDLAPERVELVWALYDDHLAELRQAEEKYRAALEAAAERAREWERKHPDVFDSWVEYGIDHGWINASMDHMAAREQARRAFEHNVTAILDDPERKAWRRIGMDLRRDRILGLLRDKWRQVQVYDLYEIVREIDLTERELEAIGESLDDYVTALDESLLRWEDNRVRLEMERMATGIPHSVVREGGEALEQARRRVERVRKQREAIFKSIKSVNERFGELLTEQLDPETARRFRAAIDKADCPRAFVPGPVEHAVLALSQVSGLSRTCRTSIDRIYDEYRTARDEWRAEFADVLRVANTPEAHAEFTALCRRFEAEGMSRSEAYRIARDHSPLLAQLQRRRELEREFTLRIREAFTSEEFERLPEHIRLLVRWCPPESQQEGGD